MTVLYIILGIIAFIVLLLLIPLNIYLEYDDEVRLKIGYLFLKFTILPQQPEKPKKGKKKKAPEKKTEVKKKEPEPKKKNPILEYADKHGLDGLLELVKVIAKIVVDVLKRTAKHLIIKKLVIRAVIAGEDSADTALKYGYACSVIYPALAMIEQNTRLKFHCEDISAGFLCEKTVVELELIAKIKPLWLLGIVISAALKFLKAIAKQN